MGDLEAAIGDWLIRMAFGLPVVFLAIEIGEVIDRWLVRGARALRQRASSESVISGRRG